MRAVKRSTLQQSVEKLLKVVEKVTTTFLQFWIKISLILGLKSQASRLFQFLNYLFWDTEVQKFTTTKKKKPLRPTVSKLTKSHKSKTKLTWKWWCRFLQNQNSHLQTQAQKSQKSHAWLLATKHGIESICNSHSFRVNWETSQMWRWVWKMRFYSQSGPFLVAVES